MLKVLNVQCVKAYSALYPLLEKFFVIFSDVENLTNHVANYISKDMYTPLSYSWL